MTSLSVFRHSQRGRIVHRRPAWIAGSFMLVLAGPGCTGQDSAAAQRQPAVASTEGLPDPLATIGGEPVAVADLEPRIGEQLANLENQYRRARHTMLHTALKEVVRERVLNGEAERHGKTLEELIIAEAGGTLDPTGFEVDAWYQNNRGRTGGRALEQIRPQIAEYLRNERRKSAAEQLEKRLYAERSVTLHLEPYRASFDNSRSPAKGPEDAAITLVEFSDFQCPYCAQFFPTLKELERNFGDRLRIVYRQFPLTNLHPYAFKAAEASLCAHEQGKFWEIHDLMFQDQKALTVRDLKLKGGRLGLDQRKFDSCLDSGQYAEQVQADLAEGSGLGVTGTPAVYINGIVLEGGAVSYEVAAKLIETELARPRR